MPERDADDDLACRICYDGPNERDALLSNVCACRGTIGHVHRGCLARCNTPVCTICGVVLATSEAVEHRARRRRDVAPSWIIASLLFGLGVCTGYTIDWTRMLA